METGAKTSEKISKNSGNSSKSPVPTKVPNSTEATQSEERMTQMKKGSKEISLPSHDRPNPASHLDIPVFKSNTIKVTQTLKAHTMAVSGYFEISNLLVLVFTRKRMLSPQYQTIKFGRFGHFLRES